jgi:hypothetical protein
MRRHLATGSHFFVSEADALFPLFYRQRPRSAGSHASP